MSFLKLFKFSILLIVINLLLPIHKSPSNKIFANEPNIKNLEKYIRSIPENNFYILGPGDIINIKVSENTKDLNIPFKVNSEGIANLQRLKRIYVSGLTLDELTKILNKEYASYVQNPNVSLDVLVYRPVKIYVDGEVANPGLHVLPGSIRSDQDLNKFNFFKIADSDQLSNSRLLNRNNSLDISSKDFMPSEIFPTVIDAIRQSGGITLYANLEDIKIIRKNSISNGGGKLSTNIDLINSLNFKDNSQNIRIMDGDFISVGKNNEPNNNQISSAFKANLNPKFIEIMFKSQDSQELKFVKLRRNTSLSELVEMSSESFLRGPIKFIRYNDDGTIDKRKFNFKSNTKRGKYTNPYLVSGDIVILGQSRIRLTSKFLEEITSPLRSFIISKEFIDIFE